MIEPMGEKTTEASLESSAEPTTERTAQQTIEPSPPERRRILRNLFLAFCIFVLVAFGVLAWYVTTDSFQQIVRRRVVSSIEKIVGGRVELGELHTIPFRLRVDARNLTIHGREAPDQPPFLHVDRLQAEMKIISLLSKTVGLHSLTLEHPVVHIIDYPDGTTNVPVPQLRLSPDQGPLEELISLSVSRIVVERGEALWQDKKFPFEFGARDLALHLNYSLLRRRYEAHVVTGSVATQFPPDPSFIWRADASLILARGRADISNLTLVSGKSELIFAGHVQDFHNPRVTGDYHGIADLRQLASLFREKQPQEGTVQFAGKGSWSPQDFSTQGTLQAKDVDWSREKLSIRNGRIDAAYAITPDRFHVYSIKANLLGGELQGEADVTNWQNSLAPPPNPRRSHLLARTPAANLQRGSVRLQLIGFPLFPAMEVMSSPKFPLDQLNLSGDASGNVDMLWVGSIHDSETRLKLDIMPPQKFAPGRFPFAA